MMLREDMLQHLELQLSFHRVKASTGLGTLVCMSRTATTLGARIVFLSRLIHYFDFGMLAYTPIMLIVKINEENYAEHKLRKQLGYAGRQ